MVDRRDIEFSTVDGTILRGWFYPAHGDATGQKSACIIMINGLAGLKEQFLPNYAKQFQANGYAALVYDQRNWGSSDGLPRSETNPIQHAQDFSDAFDFAVSLEEVDSTRVVYWGISMGGGTAIYAAAFDHRIRAIIAEVPFLSGEDMEPFTNSVVPSLYAARQAIKSGNPAKLIKMFATDKELAVKGDPDALINDSSIAELLGHLEKDKLPWAPIVTPQTLLNIIAFEPMAFIHRIAPTPILLVIADQDNSARTPLSLKTYAQALEPKKLCLLRNTGHFVLHYGEAFERSVEAQLAFLKEFV